MRNDRTQGARPYHETYLGDRSGLDRGPVQRQLRVTKLLCGAQLSGRPDSRMLPACGPWPHLCAADSTTQVA